MRLRLLLFSLLLSFGCQASEKPKERCFMVESMSLGRIYCREIFWRTKDSAILYDCQSEEGTHIKKIYGADSIYNICEDKHVKSR